MSSSNNLSRSSSSWNSISILFFPLEDFTFTGVCNTSFKAFATVLNVLGNGSFFVGASLRLPENRRAIASASRTVSFSATSLSVSF